MELLISLVLVLGNAFFVAAEYALVSARKPRVEQLVKQGSRPARLLLRALENLNPYVAGAQIAITMFGIGVGSVTEPYVTKAIGGLLGAQIPDGARVFVSILIVTFVLVVFGELVPKYLSLRAAEKIALLTIGPLTLLTRVLKPLVWLVQLAGGLVLRPFGIDPNQSEDAALSRDELLMMVRATSAEGVLESGHAEMVSRALKLDALQARDVMVHRLDIKWLDLDLTRDGVIRRLKSIPYSRVPVCNGDIDEVAGILYIHDVMRNLDNPNFDLASMIRPVIAVPENLAFERLVTTMREQKTQMLVVMDEYGGTSGLVTLEDVVEEVFGELEDRIESERPPIEVFEGGRVSARADVRYDELVSRLKLDDADAENTDTLAQIVVESLDRVPRPGDFVQTEIGTLRVENMARRRVTRVSIQLRPTAQRPALDA